MTSPSPSEPRTGHQLYHGAPFTPVDAAKLTALAVVTLYATQIVLASLGTIELVASVVSNVLVIVVVFALARRRRVVAADLGLRPARARHYIAAVLIGLSAWYLILFVVVLLKPPGDPGNLTRIVTDYPVVPTLLALTIVPAFTEELVFRGVLVRSLAGRFFPAAAIGIGAVVFAVYHLFPPQMVSTLLLGLLLGFLTLRARSIFPSMIVHALNNTIAVVLTRNEAAWLEAHPFVMLAGAIIVLACGIGLAAKGVA